MISFRRNGWFVAGAAALLRGGLLSPSLAHWLGAYIGTR